MLDALVRRFGGGPVGLSTLAVAVSEERETVEDVAEPFLVRSGLVVRTPRGRVATPAAWRHLGLHPAGTGRRAADGARLTGTAPPQVPLGRGRAAYAFRVRAGSRPRRLDRLTCS